MSAHTGETEVETIETPTPPKEPQNRREDDIIEEDPDHDSEDSDGSQEDGDEDESESEVEGNYHYTYETDSDDPFSGDIECCLRIVIPVYNLQIIARLDKMYIL